MKHLLSIRTFGPDRERARCMIIMIIIEALRMVPYYIRRRNPPPTEAMRTNRHKRKICAGFGEQSTRTKLSSEEAARADAFDVMSGITASDSSLGKGESWMNTLRMLIQFGATTVIIRDKIEGLGMFLAQCLEQTANALSWVRRDVSLIIGGAGTRDHPSQVLLDLVCIVLRMLGFRLMDEETAKGIEKLFSRRDAEKYLAERIGQILDNLRIAFIGDLLHSRVVHDWLHLGQWFDISFQLIAPKALQIEPWCLNARCSQVDSLRRIGKDTDFAYTIRLQKERLAQTMTEHDAAALVRSFKITREFLKWTRAEIMDAQPIDMRSPMISAELWHHPRVIMFMQSAIGMPTRMAILRICDTGREEHFPLLVVPRLRLPKAAYITAQRTLAEQRLHLEQKYAGRDLFLRWVKNGMVVDHVKKGRLKYIDAMNEWDGVYDRLYHGHEPGPILPGRKFPSPRMGQKEVLFAHDAWASLQLAACYGLVSPDVTVNMMREDAELRGRPGYQHLNLPLPHAVKGMFRCLNNACVTNNFRPEDPEEFDDTEVETFFWVHGQKGQEAGLECGLCEQHYPASRLLATLLTNQ